MLLLVIISLKRLQRTQKSRIPEKNWPSLIIFVRTGHGCAQAAGKSEVVISSCNKNGAYFVGTEVIIAKFHRASCRNNYLVDHFLSRLKMHNAIMRSRGPGARTIFSIQSHFSKRLRGERVFLPLISLRIVAHSLLAIAANFASIFVI